MGPTKPVSLGVLFGVQSGAKCALGSGSGGVVGLGQATRGCKCNGAVCDQKISKLFCPIAGHMSVMSLLKVREGNYKRRPGGTRWKLQVERDFSFSGAFKTSANLWGGKNLEISFHQ
jgi:hypothetical protein